MNPVDALREAAIREAAVLFSHIGYEETYFDDVLRAVGQLDDDADPLFEDAEILAFEAFDFAASLTNERLNAVVSRCDHPFDQIMTLIETLVLLPDHAPLEGGCPIIGTLLAPKVSYPPLYERARHIMESWKRLIRRVLRTGCRANVFDPNLDIEELAFVILSTLESAMQLRALYGNQDYVQRAATHLKRYVSLALQP